MSGQLAPVDISASLDADADEVIASTVADLLQRTGTARPTCQVHRRTIDACSGW